MGPRFAAVLAAAQRGDDNAFSALWRDANPGLVRYLRVLDPGEAEDVAAETWISVVRGLASFRGDESAWRCFLFTVARRRAIDHARARGRRPELFADDAGSVQDSVGGDVAEEALTHLDTRRALELVYTLPPQQAEVLMLRVVAGLDTNSVAHIVHSTPGAVRVTAHRALRALERTLDARVQPRV
jgi:RNA polymerase sigma-70 factor, ECF subfamily